MKSSHWFAVIFSILAIAWACLLALLVPQAVCDTVFEPLRAELQRPHTENESKHLAGQFCNRFGSMIQSSVALAVAPAVVINSICALMLIAVHRPVKHSTSTPP